MAHGIMDLHSLVKALKTKKYVENLADEFNDSILFSDELLINIDTIV